MIILLQHPLGLHTVEVAGSSPVGITIEYTARKADFRAFFMFSEGLKWKSLEMEKPEI